MSEQPQNANMLASLTSQMLERAGVHYNVEQQFIVITEDKLKGILHEYVDCLNIQDRWHTPASVLATLIFVISTSTFHDALAVPKETWQAICLIATGLTFLWMLSTVYRALRAKRTVEDLISEIKRTAITTTAPQSSPALQQPTALPQPPPPGSSA